MSIENSIYFQFLISVPYILPFQIPIDEINVKLKSSTLTREADPPPPGPAVAVPIKPQVPAKPAHIRPGLKPVKIPTVDDKVWVLKVTLFICMLMIICSDYTNIQSGPKKEK